MSKILVTSALPYVNGLPHLGHLVGCLLPSDVYARFMRMMGNEVLYIGGTDEHGAASEVAAMNAGVPVDRYCESFYNQHKKVYQAFDLSFDYFGRSSSEASKELTYRIFAELDANGFIKEQTTEQVYSVDDEMFLADRYIVGTCPYCGYGKARGDQCEKCTKVLEPTQLVNPKSTISGSANLEVRETRNLFLDLPKIEPRLAEWVKTKEPFWPEIAYSIAQKWLKEGLEARGITRDLKWGFPVNKPGFGDKVFYVWFDAPIGYIGITKQWADENPAERSWESWWLKGNGKEVRYVQFMGKDNVPFHSITFPATLLGTGEPWTMVDYLKGMSYLTFEGGKFSKSERRGIFLDSALEEFPADYWRYWLMANAPESSDSSFAFDLFAGAVNKDLNGVLGNFASRVLKMIESKFGGKVPQKGAPDNELLAALDRRIKDYVEYMEAMEFRKALAELRAIWVEGNEFIARAEPWSVIKTDEAKAGAILNLCANLIRVFAVLSYPIMPRTAGKMLEKLGLDAENIPLLKDFDVASQIEFLEGGEAVSAGEPLFERIAPERIEELKAKYAGS